MAQPPLMTCMHWLAGMSPSKIHPVLLAVHPDRVALSTRSETLFETPAAGCQGQATTSGVLRLTVAGTKYKLTSVRYTNVPPLPEDLVRQVRETYAVAAADPQLRPLLPPVELLVGSTLVPPSAGGLVAGVRGVKDQRASAKAVLEILRLAGASVR